MDFLNSRGFITETARYSPSQFSPPNHTLRSATQLPLPTRTQNCCWLRTGAHMPEGHSTHTRRYTADHWPICPSGDSSPFTEANQWIAAYGKNTTLWDTFSFQYYGYFISTDYGPTSALQEKANLKPVQASILYTPIPKITSGTCFPQIMLRGSTELKAWTGQLHVGRRPRS